MGMMREQSDAEPDCERAWNKAQDRIEKLEAALAQYMDDASAGLIEAAEWQCPHCMCAICTEIRSRAAQSEK
jgi:hypothetical protein